MWKIPEAGVEKGSWMSGALEGLAVTPSERRRLEARGQKERRVWLRSGEGGGGCCVCGGGEQKQARAWTQSGRRDRPRAGPRGVTLCPVLML